MGVNVALAKERRNRYAHMQCPGCERYIYQLKTKQFCKRCRDERGMTDPKFVNFALNECERCHRVSLVPKGKKLCKPCLSLKARDVLEPRLSERLASLPEFNFQDDIDPMRAKPRVPRPRHMRV